MKLGLIGFGQAGGKITDRFLEYEANAEGPNVIVDAIAINSADSDLKGLEYVPEDNRVLIGQTKVKGHGVGADNEKGTEVARTNLQQINNQVDKIDSSAIDAFLVITGLGGGTGSGGTPVLVEKLKEIYREPVYTLGVLPSEDEGSIFSLNAARSFQTVVDKSDNTILFDNNEWAQVGESVGEGYREMNTKLVKRLYLLFSAGEIQSGSREVGESIVDASEIINTLEGGGVSTIGFAENQIPDEELPSKSGLLSRFMGGGSDQDTDEIGDSAKATNRITSLVRKATLGRLTHPVDEQSTQRGLIIVSGHKKLINRKGIEESRKWLENRTGSREVRGGDYPRDTNTVSALVLLSGVTESERIKELQQIAVEAKDKKEELEESSNKELSELTEIDDSESEEELEPLF